MLERTRDTLPATISNSTSKKLPIDDAKVFDVLLKEYEITCSQIREMVSYSDRMFSLGVTLVGAVFLYGIKEKLAGVIVTVSFVSITLLLFLTTVYTAIFSLGGYRLYIAEQLNQLMGYDYLRWEKITPQVLHKSFPVLSLFAFIACWLSVIIFYGWRSASSLFNPEDMALIKAAYEVGGLLLIASFLSLLRAHRGAYRIAISGVNGPKKNKPKRYFHLLPGIKQVVTKICRRRGEDIANQIQPYLTKEQPIIDVGCGTGGVTQALRRLGHNIVGLDICSITLFPEIAFIQSDGAQLPFRDRTLV